MMETPKLVDVTNLNQPKNRRNSMAQEKKAIIGNTMVPQEKTKPFLRENSGEIKKLSTENARLLKQLREKNQIIHHAKLDLQKLQMMLQQFHFQNKHLVETNGNMLEELNKGKEKIIHLQHELKCTSATVKILKEKDLHLKGKETQSNQKTQGMVGQPLKKFSVPSQDQAVERSMRKQFSGIINLGSSTDNAPSGQGGDGASIFNSNVEILEKPIPSQGQEVQRSKRRNSSDIKLQTELPTSIVTTRPSRRATIGICYKEAPVNIKMRRD